MDNAPSADNVVPASRRAAGTAVAGGCVLASAWLVVRGFDLSLSMCALGGCSTPENSGLGFFLFALGIVIALAGLISAPLLTGAARPLARAFAAVPGALLVGLVLLLVGAPSTAAWAENVTLFVMIAVVLAILVPPTGGEWIGGLVLGIVVAAAFGDVPLPGLGLAVAAFSAAVAIDLNVPPTRRRCRGKRPGVRGEDSRARRSPSRPFGRSEGALQPSWRRLHGD